jgi:hypothetical protein
VKFQKIINDIAKKHGMTVRYFGASNNKYKEINQNNEKDIMFINRLAILEGCMIAIFDGKIIVSSVDYLENQDDIGSFEIDDFGVTLKEGRNYKKCIVYDEEKSGKYTSQSGSGTLTFEMEMSSKAEGNRFAKNLLKYYNKNYRSGCVTTDEVMDGYSGGTVVKIESDDHPSCTGNALIYRVRHDLVNGKSKLWFRCLEG